MSQDRKRIILVVAIIVITIVSIYQLQHNTVHKSKNLKSSKEVEFSDAKIVEVNRDQIKSITHAKRIYKTKKELLMFGVKFENSFKDILTSHKAIQKAKEIHFYKDVKFLRNSGFTYYTNRAIYNQKSEVLTITTQFKAVRDKDTFYGKSMVYYSDGGYIDAKKVDSILLLEQK